MLFNKINWTNYNLEYGIKHFQFWYNKERYFIHRRYYINKKLIEYYLEKENFGNIKYLIGTEIDLNHKELETLILQEIRFNENAGIW